MNDEVQQNTMRSFWMSLGWYLLGVCTGAVGMGYQYESLSGARPVVTVEQDGARQARTQQDPNAALLLATEREFKQFQRDQEEKFTRIEQQLDTLTFAARKLAVVKQTWDIKLQEAQ